MVCLKHNWMHDPRIPCPYCEIDRLNAYIAELEAELTEAAGMQMYQTDRATKYLKALEDNLHFLQGLNDNVGPNFQHHNEIMQMIHRATEALEEK